MFQEAILIIINIRIRYTNNNNDISSIKSLYKDNKNDNIHKNEVQCI